MCGCYDKMKLCTTSSGSSSQMDAGSMTSPVSPALGVSNLKTWAVSTLRAGTPGTLGTWTGKCGMSGMTSPNLLTRVTVVIHLQEQSYKQTQDYVGNWYKESVITLSGIDIDDYSIVHSHKGLNSSILSFHPAWPVESTSRESEINTTYCLSYVSLLLWVVLLPSTSNMLMILRSLLNWLKEKNN